MTAITVQQLRFADASPQLIDYLATAETATGVQDTAIATLVAATTSGTAATHYVTVTHAPPTTYVTPLIFDDSATTGGLYAWTGATYVKVGLATT